MPLYFISVIVYFWIPLAVLFTFVYRKQDRTVKKAFWITVGINCVIACVMESVYLYFDIWTFSQQKDQLLGIRVFGAPIEEFAWWFGSVPFVLLTYLGFEGLFQGRRGRVVDERGRMPRSIPSRVPVPGAEADRGAGSPRGRLSSL